MAFEIRAHTIIEKQKLVTQVCSSVFSQRVASVKRFAENILLTLTMLEGNSMHLIG